MTLFADIALSAVDTTHILTREELDAMMARIIALATDPNTFIMAPETFHVIYFETCYAAAQRKRALRSGRARRRRRLARLK